MKVFMFDRKPWLLVFLIMPFQISVGQTTASKDFNNFVLKDFDGVRHELRTIVDSNKVVVMSFWASWCNPCCRELKELKSIYKKYHSQGLEILGVDIDASETLFKAKRFVMQEQFQFIVVHDALAEVKNKYNVSTIPRMFIFDAKGMLCYDHQGYKDIALIESEIDTLLKSLH